MKIDLHVHSKYSRRPSQWVLQKLGCHECYTEPLRLYEICRKRGMDWVTITDHNTIAGCLDIAHLPDTFISEEITAYFPEDRCKIHVLAHMITEAQHRDIQKYRENIYELVDYLRQEEIPHTLAHPLWSVNGRLSVSHFEKLLLMFKNFEINGSRDDRLNKYLKGILAGLTPEFIDELADKYHLYPVFSEPWIKHFTGGSDDHSSLNITRLHTQVKGATDPATFFAGLAKGKSQVQGHASTPLTLSHTIYSIAYQFYRSRYQLERFDGEPSVDFLNQTLLDQAPKKKSFFRRLSLLRFAPKNGGSHKNSLFQAIKQEVVGFIAKDQELREMIKKMQGSGSKDMEQKWFALMGRIGNQYLSRCTQNILEGILRANLFDLFHSLTASGTMYLLVAPYFAAYSSFAGDRQLAHDIASRFPADKLTSSGNGDPAVGHFTDTYLEINGVAITLKKQVEEALRQGKSYTVISCDHEGRDLGPGVKNFPPLAALELPEYPEMKLFHPPFLEMLHYCYQQDFTHLHAATPGPMGLAALAAARLLKLPLFATYHTAIPQYAEHLTGDAGLVDFLWRYLLWFYEQADCVFVPSQSTAQELVEKGFRPDKLRLTPRGVDLKGFQPAKRNGFLESRHNVRDGLKLLYVGRVSKEKNLQLLARTFKALSRQRPDLNLIVVGEGPYYEEMQQELQGTRTVFTGYLTGEDLAAAYASCDLFVFPSTTDTFGNVVLEAQASGIPVIVSDVGGPQENVIPGETGLIVPATEEGLTRAILELTANPLQLREMGRAARRYVESRAFSDAFSATWEMYGTPDKGWACPLAVFPGSQGL
ncbi:MAG: glycosyltransferase [Desulfobaccales bacterium]